MNVSDLFLHLDADDILGILFVSLGHTSHTGLILILVGF